MKIVQVTHTFPPDIGGLSHVVENIALRLARKGLDVEVVTLDTRNKQRTVEDYKGVRVVRFPGYAPKNMYFIPSRSFTKYLAGIDADIIHLHNIGSLSTMFAWRAIRNRIRDLRYIISPHHHESGSTWHSRILWKIYKPIARRVVRTAEKVHAVSEYEAVIIRKDFEVEPVIVPNGVQEDVLKYKWNPPRDEIVLTYAGRVEKYKNVELILQIAYRLNKLLNHKIKVKIIGEGTDLPRIKRIAKNVGIDTVFTGFLERGKYLEELSSTTIYMNLSSYEAYSIVTAEALAMGVPSIIARPWAEIFTGISRAYIVDKNDLESITRTARNIVNGIPLEDREETGRKIPTWDEVVEMLLERIYRW